MALRVIHNAMQPIKQEDRHETSIVNGPRAGRNAAPQQFRQMIDNNVLHQARPRGRARTVEENIVQLRGIEITVDSSRSPRSQLPLPVPFPNLRDRRSYPLQKLLPEAAA